MKKCQIHLIHFCGCCDWSRSFSRRIPSGVGTGSETERFILGLMKPPTKAVKGATVFNPKLPTTVFRTTAEISLD